MARFPCHLYDLVDPEALFREIRVHYIKPYGSKVALGDGAVLHENYEKGDEYDGDRDLVRCSVCGALFIRQTFTAYGMPGGIGTVTHYIPAASEEEADLMNILLDEKGMDLLPVRHPMRIDRKYVWTKGGAPRPCDPGELKELIRRKYARADRDRLERLISAAGEAHAAESTPMPGLVPEPEIKKSAYYIYMVNRDHDPPALIRFGSLPEMAADIFVWPGEWKAAPDLNEIRFGSGNVIDYTLVTEEEAMEIMKRKREGYDRIAAERRETDNRKP